MTNPDDEAFERPGLSKREYFAACALMGGNTVFYIGGDWKKELEILGLESTSGNEPIIQAARCLVIADALIAALNKEPKP